MNLFFSKMTDIKLAALLKDLWAGVVFNDTYSDFLNICFESCPYEKYREHLYIEVVQRFYNAVCRDGILEDKNRK